MSEDIAFKIQLGLILPKMKELLTDNVLNITEELAKTVVAGSLENNDEFPIDSVKEILLKDFEIFVDTEIMPKIQESHLPPAAEDETNNAGEEKTEEEVAAE